MQEVLSNGRVLLKPFMVSLSCNLIKQGIDRCDYQIATKLPLLGMRNNKGIFVKCNALGAFAGPAHILYIVWFHFMGWFRKTTQYRGWFTAVV